MIDYKDKNKLTGLGLVLLYAVLAITVGLKSELYILTYMALPSCYVFLYVNFGPKTGLGLGLILALVSTLAGGTVSYVYGPVYALLGLGIYYIMGFEGQQFKKFSLAVLIALLLLIGSFVALDKLLEGPGLIEEINLLTKNTDFIDQLGKILAQSSPGAEGLIIDQNVLKLAISTLLPLFLFLTASTIAMINYPIINKQCRRLNKKIEEVAPLWRLYIPYPLVFSLVMIGMLGMMMPDIEKSFGGGLFISAFLLNSTFFVMQGFFLLAFFMQAYGLSTKYITPLCLIIFVLSLVFGLGFVFTIMLYAGLVDLIFDLRRLRRRGRR